VILEISRFRRITCACVLKCTSLRDVIAAGCLCISRMSYSFCSKELYTGQEQILRKHVDDLTRGKVTESISDAAFTIAPSHSDVDDFVLVGNYVDTCSSGMLFHFTVANAIGSDSGTFVLTFMH
jgi:hypothetical protein